MVIFNNIKLVRIEVMLNIFDGLKFKLNLNSVSFEFVFGFGLFKVVIMVEKLVGIMFSKF